MCTVCSYYCTVHLLPPSVVPVRLPHPVQVCQDGQVAVPDVGLHLLLQPRPRPQEPPELLHPSPNLPARRLVLQTRAWKARVARLSKKKS